MKWDDVDSSSHLSDESSFSGSVTSHVSSITQNGAPDYYVQHRRNEEPGALSGSAGPSHRSNGRQSSHSSGHRGRGAGSGSGHGGGLGESDSYSRFRRNQRKDVDARSERSAFSSGSEYLRDRERRATGGSRSGETSPSPSVRSGQSEVWSTCPSPNQISFG